MLSFQNIIYNNYGCKILTSWLELSNSRFDVGRKANTSIRLGFDDQKILIGGIISVDQLFTRDRFIRPRHVQSSSWDPFT